MNAINIITRLGCLVSVSLYGVHMHGSKYLPHRYKQVNTQRHLLLWEPLRILSNSAPKIWSSVIWLNGVESSKGFQSAISADRDLPPAVTALESSPCFKNMKRCLSKMLTSIWENVTTERTERIFPHWNTNNMFLTSFHICTVNSMTVFLMQLQTI